MKKRATKFIDDKVVEGGTPFEDWLSDVYEPHERRDFKGIAEYFFNQSQKLGRGGKRKRKADRDLEAIKQARGNYGAYLDAVAGEGVSERTFRTYTKILLASSSSTTGKAAKK